LRTQWRSCRRNTVFGCGGAAISIASGNMTLLTPGNTSVIGNTITNFSRIQRTYAAGVSFSGVSNYVANNTITHAPHTAITGGGNENLFEVRKTPFLRCHFILTMINLPRQARDKHRESAPKKEWCCAIAQCAPAYLL
jgi:hypothetical protein